MARPRLCRRIRFKPDAVYFKPQGIPMRILEEVAIGFDEFEAVRLKDLEELDETSAAKKMNISQPTFNRLIKEARKKISEALIKGKAIKIEGGSYKYL